MKLLTERTLIREVAQRWAEQYSDAYWRKDKEKQDIGRRLKALDPERATASDVADIIGNDSWTRIDHCEECGAENIPAAVRLADTTSGATDICLPCLRKAVRLAELERSK